MITKLVGTARRADMALLVALVVVVHRVWIEPINLAHLLLSNNTTLIGPLRLQLSL